MAEPYRPSPAPTRFIEGQPVVPPIPVEFRWPTIAEVVTQATSLSALHVVNP